MQHKPIYIAIIRFFSYISLIFEYIGIFLSGTPVLKTRDNKTMASRMIEFMNVLGQKRPVLENLLLALWLIIVIIITLNHELWRDEVRSINLAIGISSFSEFIEMAKYDGHPILWRSILALIYEVYPIR